MSREHDALQYAADELLLDSTFAAEIKRRWYILKISMLSGRSTTVMSRGDVDAEDVVEKYCRRLGIRRSGMETLIHGTEVVPPTVNVEDWPGVRPQGEVSE